MFGPEDYGLSPLETLAHVGDPTAAPGHAAYWTRWGEEIWASEPSLRHGPPSPADANAGATHHFESLRHVRIGARLIEPAGDAPPRALVLALHGYHVDEPLNDDSPWTDRSLAVCKLRVRGYPGSQADVGDLMRRPGGWITEGLESRETWIMRAAVADVVNAFRALRARYGPCVPISLAGESFGGGLAILAAAQLLGRDRVERLAIGLPTFGDWPWRLMHAHQDGAGLGSGAEVARFILDHAAIADEIAEALRTFDAAIHARRIACPVLCKLAQRDDVVPAPSAAAIYNALGVSPGMKWRFLTAFGHFDGGLADLRRHAEFERLAAAFLDPSEDLASLMNENAPTLCPAGVQRP